MYSRPFITENDTTTQQGTLRATCQTMQIGTPPAFACYEGDFVYCPACKSEGRTQCVPPFRPWTGPDGRQANLDGDLCLCKCPTPPRLKALHNFMVMSFDESELVNMQGIAGWMNHAGITPQTPWIAFEVDSDACYAGVQCVATMDNGQTFHGTFDENNHAMFMAIPGTHCVSLAFDSKEEDSPEGDSVAASLIRQITE